MSNSISTDINNLNNTPPFDPSNFKYSYVFGNIVKITIHEEFSNKDGLHYTGRTECGNVRNIHESKLFETVADTEAFIKTNRR